MSGLAPINGNESSVEIVRPITRQVRRYLINAFLAIKVETATWRDHHPGVFAARENRRMPARVSCLLSSHLM